MNNRKTMTFEELKKLVRENIKKLPSDASYDKIDNELEKASFEGFCKQLDFLATSDDEKAKSLFDTFKRGWKEEYGDIEVVTGDVFIRELHPTQNVIYANKSLGKILDGTWNVDGYEFAVDAFLSKKSPLIEMGDPLVVCEIDGTYYLIDGHHRWSKAYAFNPNCMMKAHLIKNSGKIFNTPDDVLKFAQGTLTAMRKSSPINAKQVNDINMYKMTARQLIQLVDDNITEEVLDHIKRSKLGRQVVSDVSSLCSYLWANINTMKMYAPAGIHSRIFMPQYPDGDSNPANAVLAIAAESREKLNGAAGMTLEELGAALFNA